MSCDAIFQMIADRYIAIRDECGLNVDIEAELAVLRQQMRAGISEEELVSRGEYFSTKARRAAVRAPCSSTICAVPKATTLLK